MNGYLKLPNGMLFSEEELNPHWPGYTPTPTKCQCGVYVTYGKNAPLDFHQDYCDIGKDYRKQLESDKELRKLYGIK